MSSAPLTPERLRAALRPALPPRPIQCFDSIPSTQQAALLAAQAGAPAGALFVAEAQTAGRGRHGHAWSSPPGAGIYASLVLRPSGSPAALLPLTLAAALAVADAVRALAGLDAEIRWPNDLLLEGRKFSGLLLEVSADAARIHHAALGIGINVHSIAFPPDLAPIATSLADHAAPPDRAALLAAVVEAVEQRCRDFARGGPDPILREFERRSAYACGFRARVGQGADAYCGVTDGLDPAGFLRVRLPGGALRIVISGDVRPA